MKSLPKRERVRFKLSSVDMIPLGDIGGTVQLLITCNPKLDFLFTRSYRGAGEDRREFTLDTRELRQVLGEVPLDTPEVMEWIDGYLREQERPYREN